MLDISLLIPETLPHYKNLIPNHLFFFSSLIFVMAIVWKIPVLSKKMESLALENNERVFSANSPYEFNKFALLRIVFGVLITLRGAHVLSLLLNSELNTAVGFYVIAEILAGLMLIFGLFTQWALIFLIGVMWQIGDYVVAKPTLADDVAAILGVLLIMVNAGKFLSLDSLIVKKAPSLHKFLLYYRGIPSPSIIFYAKFTALFSYWAVCVYSFSIHLNETAWTSGTAGPLLLTNNFMSAWHVELTELFVSSSLAVFVAKLSLWLMILWYCTVLPFVFIGGFFRKYVIIWGWMFIALSLFVLQLGGYLAEIEVLFWLALFWSYHGMRQDKTISVLYDDRCNLCDRTVQVVTILDIFGQVRLKPLSKNKQLVFDLGLKLEEALTDLYGVRDGDNKMFRGYDFYIQLSKSLVLLWPILPFLLMGKIFIIGPILYRFIASRRRKLFGICKLPRKKFTFNEKELISQSRIPFVLSLHIFLLGIFYFLAIPAPYVNYYGIKNVGANAAHIYGIAPINVFNHQDAHMAENWFVLRSFDFDEVLPILKEDGSRLGMHQSDRIYFGHTVGFRRSSIRKKNKCRIEEPGWERKINYLSKVYLQLKDVEPGSYKFNYEQLHQPLVSQKELEANTYPSKTPPVTKCEMDYLVSYP